MERLTTCADGMEARILAARLGAAGIVWSIRGGYDGPLAIGAVDLLVEADDLDAARELLSVERDDGPATASPTTWKDAAVIALVLLALAMFALLRMGARV